MIGADTITLEAQGDADRLLKSLKSFDWIKSTNSFNGTIELMVDHAQARVPEVMAEAYKNNVTIKSVGLHEPTLEDVFLKFTGKKMREAEASGGMMHAMMMPGGEDEAGSQCHLQHLA